MFSKSLTNCHSSKHDGNGAIGKNVFEKERINNGARPHGGVRGLRQHPPSSHSFDKSTEYYQQLEKDVMQYIDANDVEPVPKYVFKSMKTSDKNGSMLMENGYLPTSKHEKRTTHKRSKNRQKSRNAMLYYRPPNNGHDYSTLEPDITTHTDYFSPLTDCRHTKASLLRARQRCNSAPMEMLRKRRILKQKIAEEYSETLQEPSLRMKAALNPTCLDVKEIVEARSNGKDSVYSYMIGARYNRAHCMDARLAQDFNLYVPRHNINAMFFVHHPEERSPPSAPPVSHPTRSKIVDTITTTTADTTSPAIASVVSSFSAAQPTPVENTPRSDVERDLSPLPAYDAWTHRPVSDLNESDGRPLSSRSSRPQSGRHCRAVSGNVKPRATLSQPIINIDDGLCMPGNNKSRNYEKPWRNHVRGQSARAPIRRQVQTARVSSASLHGYPAAAGLYSARSFPMVFGQSISQIQQRSKDANHKTSKSALDFVIPTGVPTSSVNIINSATTTTMLSSASDVISTTTTTTALLAKEFSLELSTDRTPTVRPKSSRLRSKPCATTQAPPTQTQSNRVTSPNIDDVTITSHRHRVVELHNHDDPMNSDSAKQLKESIDLMNTDQLHVSGVTSLGVIGDSDVMHHASMNSLNSESATTPKRSLSRVRFADEENDDDDDDQIRLVQSIRDIKIDNDAQDDLPKDDVILTETEVDIVPIETSADVQREDDHLSKCEEDIAMDLNVLAANVAAASESLAALDLNAAAGNTPTSDDDVIFFVTEDEEKVEELESAVITDCDSASVQD